MMADAIVGIIEGMGHDGKRYELGKIGEQLWIRFFKQPSGWLRAYLNRLGYKRYDQQADQFIGIEDQEQVRERIKAWAETPQHHKDKESTTICWDCAKAYGGCSWSAKFEPVAGWTAEKMIRQRWRRGMDEEWESYDVRECPEFEVEDRMKMKRVRIPCK